MVSLIDKSLRNYPRILAPTFELVAEHNVCDMFKRNINVMESYETFEFCVCGECVSVKV